jgi:hypothetical protein
MQRGINDAVDSLQILPHPPRPGDPGYDLFRAQLKRQDPGAVVPGSSNHPEQDPAS